MPFAARIIGTGSAYPAKRVSNVDLARRLARMNIETSDGWIRERTGICERRYADLMDGNERNSSLATESARQALQMAGRSEQDIDLIIVATCSPETLIPSTACWLQQKLGATRAWAMDVNAACTGFVYGLVTAAQFILNGQSKTALIVGSEVLHPFLNWRDRASCILFGDAAGAVILEQVPVESEHRVLSWQLQSDGRFGNLLYIPANGSEIQTPTDPIATGHGKMVMNGREIFKVAVRTLTDLARLALKKQGIGVEAVDWFVPHQANLRILEAVAERLGIPMEKVLVNVDRYGNTSSATIPTVLDEAVRDGRILPGHLLLMDAFGAGFTYGAILVRW